MSPGVRPVGADLDTIVRSLDAVVVALRRTAVVVALYGLYAWARDLHGDSTVAALQTAQQHARQIARLQAALPLPDERSLQAAVLPAQWLVRLLGAFYGTAHFAVTATVLAVLLVRRPERLARDGSVLATVTFVAVGIFALYPVAPPRLMPAGEAMTDTLETVGSVWSYDHGVLERIADPYAAMPSLHVAWATWVALVVWRLAGTTRRPWLWRTLGTAHVCITLVAVVVTGAHWYLDVVAGAILVLAVSAACNALQRRRRQP